MSRTSQAVANGPAAKASPVDARFAWLAIGLAAWIIGGLFVLAYGYTSGLAHDSVVSVYHIPLYTGVIALAVVCVALIIRANRAGGTWRSAFPSGYGFLAAGAVVLVAWPIVEIGWRQGVGIGSDDAEQILAPSRIVLFVGCLLVAVGPLVAATRQRASGTGRWPAVLSASFIFLVLSVFGLQPAQGAWLEAPASDPQSRSEIWVMNADGSHQTQLISPPAGFDVGDPAWSADGTRIAFVRSATPARFGQLTVDISIWLASADGGDQRELIAGVGWYWLPHWSPDGQWITFTIDAQHGPGSGAGVLPPAGGYGQPPGAAQPPAVAPNVDIWRVRADGSGQPELLSTDPAEDRAAVYSPDGQYLLFDSTRTEGRTGLYVAAADGSNPTALTNLGDDWGGSWSPDMTRVAFNSSPTGGAYEVYVTAFPRAGSPTQLTFDLAGDTAPSWSPDGKRIAFASQQVQGKDDIWSMAADGSDQQNLTATRGVAESMTSGGQAWGPDDRILYMRSQDGPAATTSFVRQGLGSSRMLLGALVLSLLVIVLVRLDAPFGAVAVTMSLAVLVIAATSGDWRFVPAAILGGLIADLLIRLAADRRKAMFGAVAAAIVFVLGAGITVLATSVLGWSGGLLIGVAMAAGLLAGGAALLLPQWTNQALDEGG